MKKIESFDNSVKTNLIKPTFGRKLSEISYPLKSRVKFSGETKVRNLNNSNFPALVN